MKSRNPKKRKKNSYPKKSQSFYCQGCNINFISRTALVNHGIDKPDDHRCNENIVICVHCKKRFLNRIGFNIHIRKSPQCAQKVEQLENINTIDISSSSNPDIINTHTRSNHIISTATHKDPSSQLNVSLQQISSINSRKNSLYPSSNRPPRTVFDSSSSSVNQKYVFNIQKIKLHFDSLPNESSRSHQDIIDNEYFHLTSLMDRNSEGCYVGSCYDFVHRCYSMSFEHTSPHIHSQLNDDTALSFFQRFKEDYNSSQSEGRITVDNRLDLLDESIQNDSQTIANQFDAEDNVQEDNVLNPVDTSIANIHIAAQDVRNPATYSNKDVAMLDLQRILKPIAAPLYIFDELTKWCQRHTGAFGENQERVTTRETFIKSLPDRVYGDSLTIHNLMKPQTSAILLHSGDNIDISKFSLRGNLFSLLGNEEIMNPENLLLDVHDPFSIPEDTGIIDDINTGWWYRETHHEICTGPTDILLPLLLFIDSGKVTEHLSVEPIVFTLGIFNRQLRNLPKAWRTLGYIEDLDNSNVKKSQKSVQERTRDYHLIISEILSELKVLQHGNAGFSWKLKLGDLEYDVVFKLAIQVILGDCMGHDKLCLHTGSTHQNSNVLCRDCITPTNISDDPDHRCIFLTKQMIDIMTNDERTNICKRNDITNAFDDIYFGARHSSIYDCTPPEPLHQFLLGIIKYMMNVFFKDINKSSKKELSKSVQHIYKNCSRQSSRDYPSIASIQNCVDKPGTLSASEQYSRLFAIFMACKIPEVFEQLSTHQTKEWVLLFEETLVLYQWLMAPTHKKEDLESHFPGDVDGLESKAQSRIRGFMRRYQRLVQRDGNGLKINKFHQLLHYVRQILKDGSIQNIDTGRPESNAVAMYKNLSSTTQLRQKSLIKQVAQRHYEDILFDEASRLSRSREENFVEIRNEKKKVDHSSKYDLRLQSFNRDQNGVRVGQLTLKWLSGKTSGSFKPNIMISLAKRLFLSQHPDYGSLKHHSVVRGFTEYIHPESKQLFRAHPNYRSKGSWYDWCTIKWDSYPDPIPAKIITFLDLSNSVMMTYAEMIEMNMLVEGENIDDVDEHEAYLVQGLWVLIQSGKTLNESTQINTDDEYFTSNSVKGHIVDSFVLEDQCRLVPIETIESSCYCIEQHFNEDGDHVAKRFMYFKDIKEWADIFVNKEY